MTPALAIYILLAAVSLAVLAFQLAGTRKRRRRLSGNMLMIGAVLFGWQVCAVIGLLETDPAVSLLLVDIRVAFAALAAIGFLFFTLKFYSLNQFHTPTTVFITCMVPIMTVLLAASQKSPFLRLRDGSRGPWFWIQLLYNLCLLIVAIAVVAKQYRSIPRFYRNSTKLLLLGLILTLAGSAVDGFRPANLPISISLIAATFCLVMMHFASRINHGIDYLNQARDEIFNELDEAILILDDEDNIISRNLAAQHLMFSARIDVGLESYPEILAKLFGAADATVLNDAERNGTDYEIETSEGSRVYNLRRKPMQDKRGTEIGSMIICTDVTEDHETIRRLEVYAGMDAMTGLYNRAYFERKLAELDDEAFLPAAVLIADLDGLKVVNDTMGHHHGDLVIRRAAQILVSNCPPSTYVARMGGDEFEAVIPNFTGRQAEDLIATLAEVCHQKDDRNIQVSLSVGYAIKTDVRTAWRDVAERADRRMYDVKNAKRAAR